MPEENLYTPKCIRTVTGKYVNIFDPKSEMFCIEDIAHALANMPRFGGHLPRFYSVAEHCMNGVGLLAEHNYPKSVQFDFLMHDCSEAYLMDMAKPIKPHLSNYMELEHNLMKVLSGVFSFHYPLLPEVKKIDEQMLRIEWAELMIKSMPRTLPASLRPVYVKKQFLQLFNYLKP